MSGFLVVYLKYMASRFLVLSRTNLIHLVTLFLVLFYNIALFRRFVEVYPVSAIHLLYLFSIALVLAAVIEILLNLLCFWRGTRIVLIVILMVSAMASYFMDTYNTVLDTTMIGNIFQTNAQEAGDLFNFKLLLYFVLLGLLPSLYIY